MTLPTTVNTARLDHDLSDSFSGNERSNRSAVSWVAVLAGAVAAASLSLILLILGVGLGLSSVSPWVSDGLNAKTLGVSTILWLTLTQLLASAMGGYLAGRLRIRWTDVHDDEVYFRDTAHGFLSWAVASLVTAVLLTSVIGSIISGGAQAGASMMGGVANTASFAVSTAAASDGRMQEHDGGPMGYFVDALFRRESVAAAPTAGVAGSLRSERAMGMEASEVSRIFLNVSRSQPLPPEDIRYVGQIVAQRTGLSQRDAEKRVSEVYARAQVTVLEAEAAAREAADKVRKASAYSALWLFVSLLGGAFAASLAATVGGRRRDA